MQPLVSIVMTAYNTENFIGYAIRSVINQSYVNWRLLILDDGSTDETLSVARSFKDSRITVLSDGRNKGIPIRRNETIDWAEGKYYAILDSDDIMHYRRIEKQVEFLEEHLDVDVLGSSMYCIDDENNLLYERVNDEQYDVTVLANPSVMGKTEWFRRNRYNVKMKRAQDAELWLRTKSHSVFYVCTERMIFYREYNIPTLKKYCEAQICMIKNIYFHPKRYNITPFYALKRVVVSCMKMCIGALGVVLGRKNLLLELRSKSPISNKETAKADLKKSISS